MIQAAKEFINILDNIYGVYLDSSRGFYLLREESIKTQQFTSKQVGMSIADLDNSISYYGVGDPNKLDSYVLHECTQGQLKKRNEKDGDNYSIIANLCIVLIYQYWEDHYRGQIAKELELPRKNNLKSNIMGDLRLLRTSIVHHKAIAKGEVENCILLQWFKKGDTIYVNSKMFESIIFHIKEYIRQMDSDST